jgi:hypothetical protein
VPFRINGLAFSYPHLPLAVWIKDTIYSQEQDVQYVVYTYRFPYDPERDSNVHAEGHYSESSYPVSSYFKLDISESKVAEPILQYVQRTHPELDTSTATTFHKGSFDGLVFHFTYSGGDAAGDQRIAIFRVKTCNAVLSPIFEMTDDEFMFSEQEFTSLLNSTVLFGAPICSN